MVLDRYLTVNVNSKAAPLGRREVAYEAISAPHFCRNCQATTPLVYPALVGSLIQQKREGHLGCVFGTANRS